MRSKNSYHNKKLFDVELFVFLVNKINSLVWGRPMLVAILGSGIPYVSFEADAFKQDRCWLCVNVARP